MSYVLLNIQSVAKLGRRWAHNLQPPYAPKVSSEDVNNPVRFGKLSRTGSKTLNVSIDEKYIPEDSDGYDKEEYDLAPRKKLPYYRKYLNLYARRQPNLRKALELFEDLKVKDKLTPDQKLYSLMIYSCSKAGFTRKAFELYRESMNYSKKPTGPMVTGLIKACGESPFPEYGLDRLNWLRDHLKFDLKYECSQIHYHAYIRAYGALGQPEKVSEIFSEMVDKQMPITTKTFNRLLSVCISQKTKGTILALRLFKVMRLYDLNPDQDTYGLILRCIADCGLGSREVVLDTIQNLPGLTTLTQKIKYDFLKERTQGKSNKLKKQGRYYVAPALDNIKKEVEKSLNIKLDKDNTSIRNIENPSVYGPEKQDTQAKRTSCEIINYTVPESDLIIPPPSLGVQPINLLSEDHIQILQRIEAIDFKNFSDNPSTRLQLFGGIHGFLQNMKQQGCPPDTRTIQLLLNCSPKIISVYVEVYRLAIDHQVKVDEQLFNYLIASVLMYPLRCYATAFYFIDQMQTNGLRPTMSTLEALARGCRDIEGVRKFMDDLKSTGFVMTSKVIENIMFEGMKTHDYKYWCDLIDFSIEYEYKPPKHILESMETHRLQAREAILKLESGLLDHNDHKNKDRESATNTKSDVYIPQPIYKSIRSRDGIRNFERFSKKFDRWLKQVTLAEDLHPWKQYELERTSVSHRRGFMDFVEQFRALEEAKLEALKAGGRMGNLTERAEQIMQERRERRQQGKRHDDGHDDDDSDDRNHHRLARTLDRNKPSIKTDIDSANMRPPLLKPKSRLVQC